ncbi:CBS domain-containing protein [Sulfurisphaera ohwakuensis]|uniref:CBS domain-containing protein n=1 Tax=Sulfurisphaera ohwakuensis TaxID=69656 RepID=A0A650CJZ0_SULOH|nr:CBS domain-containing protein [Sulfurisphaera ohwakuensis]MBB5254284.1 CBS domain-containing protein [Sulfurisphaera ohwakuensis]QGR18181.1 CBS domain-containing protein [Sulfurisphaera ohwakuensis]
MEPIVIIDADRCVGCFMCEKACALAKCIEVDEVDRIAKVVRPWDCTGCGACERVCPYSCIIVISDPTEVSKRAKITVSRVTRYMNKPVIMCNGNERIYEVAKIMSNFSIASLPFYREEKLNIITESDVVKLYLNRKDDISNFENPAITVTEKETVFDAIKIMLEKDIGHLPVISVKGEIIGMLSIRDCLRGISVTDIINTKLLPFKGTESIRDVVKDFKHIVVDENTILIDALQIMNREKVKALIVQGEKIGIFTIRDAIKMIGNKSKEDEKIKPREVPILSINDKINKAVGIMLQHNLRHIIISDENSNYYLMQVKELIKDMIWVEKSITD